MSLNYPCFCELSPDRKRIQVFFRYNEGVKDAFKQGVNGARFVPKDKGGPFWTIPKDMTSARELRKVFGDGLEMGDAVKAWAKEARKNSRNLQKLAKADSAELKRLPEILPALDEFLRPFQKADVAFIAGATGGVGNFNEQGLGKTVEAVAAVFESGLNVVPTLVVAPKTSLETVWGMELDRWSPDPYFVLSGDTTAAEKAAMLKKIVKLQKKKKPFWFITTASQVRSGLPEALKRQKWGFVIIDEFHKTGLTNINGNGEGTIFGKAVKKEIKRQMLLPMSGTPIGGRPIRLWGVLNHMKPEVFTSKWRWAGQWLGTDKDDYGHHTMGSDILPEKEDEFYPYHAEFIVRRLKAEVLPQLPPKQYIDVWCDMLPGQKKQYEKMAKDAEIFIDNERLSAAGVLAEYARLKQFASAERTILDGALIPKASGKLEPLIERLHEAGIDPDDPEGDNVAVVASASKVFIKWIAEQLNAKKIRTELITGDTKAKDRKSIVERFQSGVDSPRVVAVTTQAGGVAITMDRADTVHILDETWNPDDQVQLEDRIHRISRIHQVMCYYYRTKETVEEAIHEVNEGKAVTNGNIMDIRRAMFKKD